MAATIRFKDGRGLEEGVRIFRQHGDTVPTGNPDTYYVSDRILELLRSERVDFEILKPEEYGLMQVTEEMFAELRQAVEESHQGKHILVKDPKDLDAIIDAE